MVDREARNRMAELLRHFVAARIDTDELVSGLYYRGRDHTAAYILGCRAVIGLFTGNWAREDVADEIWPFAGLDEYEEALKSPKLLCGKRAD